MTRIFTDGAEMGDAQFWDFNNFFAPITAVTVPAPYASEWSYKGAWLGAYRLVSLSSNEFYLRYRVYCTNPIEAHGASMLGWRHGGNQMASFTVDHVGRFCARVGTTEVEVAPIVMQFDTWYLVEVHFVLADDGTGRFEALLDGTQIIDYTGVTNPQIGVITTIDNIYFLTNAYTIVYVDDLALNDTAGVDDNSWCGDGIIIKMVPNGDGEHNNWTNSDGDSVANWSYVDEYPNDGDLTYVMSDGGVADVQDQYTLTDLDYTNKTVLRIYPEARARKTAVTGTLKLGILPSGGVDDVSAARTLYEDYYARIVGNEYKVNPLDSNPWEELDLDALELIIETG